MPFNLFQSPIARDIVTVQKLMGHSDIDTTPPIPKPGRAPRTTPWAGVVSEDGLD